MVDVAFRAFNDHAVNEVVGYIIMFAVSSIILIVAVRSLTEAREGAEEVVSAVEFKNLANRVSARVVQAGIVAQDFPEASFSTTLNLPSDVDGRPYYIQATSVAVYVNASKNDVTVNATTFKLDALATLQVYVEDALLEARVRSHEETLVVKYVPSYTCPAPPGPRPCVNGAPTIVLIKG